MATVNSVVLARYELDNDFVDFLIIFDNNFD